MRWIKNLVRQITNGMREWRARKKRRQEYHQTQAAKRTFFSLACAPAGPYHIPAWLTTNSMTTSWHVRLVASTHSLKGLWSAKGARSVPNISECQKQRMKWPTRVSYSHLDRSRMAPVCTLVCSCHPFKSALPFSNTQIGSEGWVFVVVHLIPNQTSTRRP
jgi:hypothetical protein